MMSCIPRISSVHMRVSFALCIACFVGVSGLMPARDWVFELFVFVRHELAIAHFAQISSLVQWHVRALQVSFGSSMISYVCV